MLDPHDRRLLLDSFRPPAGYELNWALGTTYSLDLIALLTAPLAFTFFDWEDEEGRPAPDPLALLEALRRHASHISLFCQAGEIKVPGQRNRLVAYLEDSIHEVQLRNSKGVFHPKVWCFRFTNAGQPVRYRFLCLSRNLTFDRSWDSMVALDGELLDRETAIAANHGLADFVKAMPELVQRPLSATHVTQINLMESELRRVRWNLPEGFQHAKFWPLGIPGYTRYPFKGTIDRFLAVSPFLDNSQLNELSDLGARNTLVSRLEELQAASSGSLKGFEKVYFLNPALEIRHPESREDEKIETGLRGLHSKLYIVEKGWDARVWTGSANATTRAFKDNVEFLVGLKGKRSRCGIDAFLDGDDGRGGFGKLLQEYLAGEEVLPPDEEMRRLEEVIRTVKREIIASRLDAVVVPTEGGHGFDLALRLPDGHSLGSKKDVQIRCWPVTISEDSAVPILDSSDNPARFGPLADESLTPFFAFEVMASRGEKRATNRFVLVLQLIGAPAGRRDRILRSLLQNRSEVMRFLMLLLADVAESGVAGLAGC